MKTSCTVVMALVLVAASVGQAWGRGDEHMGNDPLSDANYKDWPGIMPVVNSTSRVYQIWVNGNEFFYYRGSVEELNAALVKFAAIEAEAHEVVLRPGPGEAKTFKGQTIACDWNLHVIGGIAKHLTTLERGEKIWSKSPVLTVYVTERIPLDQLQVPGGVTLVGVDELKKRAGEALGSGDKTVRGWANGELATLDQYDTESMAAIAGMLKDKDSWVRLNAASTLPTFGALAKPTLDDLRTAAKDADDPLKAQIEKSVKEIEGAQPDEKAARLHRERLETIEGYLEARRKAL